MNVVKWEHKSVNAYDGGDGVKIAGKEQKVTDWYVPWRDMDPTIGMNNILNHLGSQGWELVSVLPTGRTQMGYHAASSVLLFFKRPMATSVEASGSSSID